MKIQYKVINVPEKRHRQGARDGGKERVIPAHKSTVVLGGRTIFQLAKQRKRTSTQYRRMVTPLD